MSSIVEFVKQSEISGDCESESELNETIKPIQPVSGETPDEPVGKAKKPTNKKPVQPKAKSAKTPKSKVQEEPVSNELGKLITKSEEKPKKQVKSKASK